MTGKARRNELNAAIYNGSPYRNLANAIVLQACDDYRKAKMNGNSHRIAEIRRFFRSQWFQCLTSVDGEMIIDRLDEEAYQKKICKYPDDVKKKVMDMYASCGNAAMTARDFGLNIKTVSRWVKEAKNKGELSCD